jgi:hypothetical protein
MEHAMSRHRALLCQLLWVLAILFAGLLPTVGKAEIRVLSGSAALNAKRILRGSVLHLRKGAVAQFLLDDDLVFSVSGRATFSFEEGARGAVLSFGRLARLSGKAGRLSVEGFQVQLSKEGGAVLFVEDRFYVLWGEATIIPPSEAEIGPFGRFFRELRDSEPSRSPLVLVKGQVGILVLGGGVTVQSHDPDPRLIGELRAQDPPPPWKPEFGGVSPGEMRKVERWTEERNQSQREASSCGCTESSSSTGPSVLQETEVTPLERINTQIKIRVRGLPKKVQ